MLLRKTKIITTIGPASDEHGEFEKMIKAGVNLTRLNFSHGDYEYHGKVLNMVRASSKKLGVPIAVIQDLQGPKIRTGELYKEKVVLKKGTTLILTTKECIGDEIKQFINYRNLPKEVKKKDLILIDDGKIKLEVLSVSRGDIKCKIIDGGSIVARRGVNVPGVSLKINSLTEKDKKDAAWGVKYGVDFIALSFVKRAKDVKQLRKIVSNLHGDVGIIAKIETYDAVNNIDEIIKESDAIMIASGDLAVETPPEEVPMLQKRIINKCNKAGKPVIVATQMLESMIYSPVATRAEVSDVANSILDGADAVMLSAETAVGDYPVASVQVMANIADKTEKCGWDWGRNIFKGDSDTTVGVDTFNTVDAITHHVVNTAHDINAQVIVALTESGSTARMISRHRPKQPIIVLSPSKKVLTRIILSSGCYPYGIASFKYVGEVIETTRKILRKEKFGKDGSKFVIAAGVPFGKTGGTNLLMVQKV